MLIKRARQRSFVKGAPARVEHCLDYRVIHRHRPVAVARGRCRYRLRYRRDPAVGKRFDTLTTELGDAFIRVELEGRGHSTVTTHRQQAGVDAVLDFFNTNLR